MRYFAALFIFNIMGFKEIQKYQQNYLPVYGCLKLKDDYHFSLDEFPYAWLYAPLTDGTFQTIDFGLKEDIQKRFELIGSDEIEWICCPPKDVLLKAIPEEINFDDKILRFEITEDYCAFVDIDQENTDDDEFSGYKFSFKGRNLTDSLFNAITWCIENNIIIQQLHTT